MILFLCFSFLVSCQSVPPEIVTKQTYLEFDEGIGELSRGLLTKLQQRQGSLPTKKTLLFNPFLEINSGQILQASLDIEEKFIEEVHQHFNHFEISRLTLSKLEMADYIVNGLIKYEGNLDSNRKYYQISAAIVDLSTKTVVTNGTVWIESSGLNYKPTPSYEDNPIYIKGKLLQYVIKTVNSPVGTLIDDNDYTFIKTKAQLIEAQTAYDNNNYKQALNLFNAVLARPNGKVIETYGGLYATHFKLGHLEEAERNFGKMVVLGAKKGTLPVKFLFQSQMRDFVEIPALIQQYAIWVRQISLYFKRFPTQCVYIIGHTSKYGIYDLNKELSKKRAEKIQNLMGQTFAGIFQRSKTIGRGSDEMIVGTTPDSAENAIDRRVEFKIINC